MTDKAYVYGDIFLEAIATHEELDELRKLETMFFKPTYDETEHGEVVGIVLNNDLINEASMEYLMKVCELWPGCIFSQVIVKCIDWNWYLLTNRKGKLTIHAIKITAARNGVEYTGESIENDPWTPPENDEYVAPIYIE